MVLEVIQTVLIWLLMAVLVFNLSQRKHRAYGERKRVATLFIAGGVMVLYGAAITINRFALPHWLFLPVTAAVIAVFIWKKDLLPYKTHCVSCGEKLSFQRFLYYDSNLCENCDDQEQKRNDDTENR